MTTDSALERIATYDPSSAELSDLRHALARYGISTPDSDEALACEWNSYARRLLSAIRAFGASAPSWSSIDDIPDEQGSTVMLGWRDVKGRQQSLIIHREDGEWRAAGGLAVDIKPLIRFGVVWTCLPSLPPAA